MEIIAALFTLQKQGERSENELATDMYFNRAIYPDVSSVAGLMRTDNAHPHPPCMKGQQKAARTARMASFV